MQEDYEVSNEDAAVILRLPASKVLEICKGWGSDTKSWTPTIVTGQRYCTALRLCDEAVCALLFGVP